MYICMPKIGQIFFASTREHYSRDGRNPSVTKQIEQQKSNTLIIVCLYVSGTVSDT